jgi:type IV pilus assembly protein PilE
MTTDLSFGRQNVRYIVVSTEFRSVRKVVNMARCPASSPVRQPRGFTLVEMVVVVASIAILTSIALPAYRDSVMRGKIPDAMANLATKRVQMEQYFQDNRTYQNVSATIVASACVADTTTSQYFDFSCTGQTATAFTLQAVGKADMAGFTYTIDQAGTRRTTAVPAGWGTAPIACWVVKKGGTC